MVLSILLICLPRNGSIIGYLADDRTNKARFEGHHPYDERGEIRGGCLGEGGDRAKAEEECGELAHGFLTQRVA